jgi:hypothetical protein
MAPPCSVALEQWASALVFAATVVLPAGWERKVAAEFAAALAVLRVMFVLVLGSLVSVRHSASEGFEGPRFFLC